MGPRESSSTLDNTLQRLSIFGSPKCAGAKCVSDTWRNQENQPCTLNHHKDEGVLTTPTGWSGVRGFAVSSVCNVESYIYGQLMRPDLATADPGI